MQRKGDFRANAMHYGAGSSPNAEAGRLGLKLGNTQGATMRSIIIGLIGVLPFVASPVLAADAATQEGNK